ncbi:MAG: prephenate dehydrogenase/arogenate dehydrogenase family protein [Candidatus Omnitrophica bacterium]|nr:prephenate dehydrogenase/arogenate dehydrogenase family protein [Candidatus Omnitrophota bacterium]
MFRKVTIIGIGLMGGSLALSLKKHHIAKEVVGLSRNQSSIMQAIKKQAIDNGTTDIKEAVRNSDLVVFATPVDTIVKLLPTVNANIKRGCLLTDMGSTKAAIVDAAQKALSFPGNFVGSHPLAGSEKGFISDLF